MRIKRYLARDMSEAVGLIKADLGPDAVIISSRKVRSKGLFGFFRPRRLEVTAALDEKGTVPLGPKGDYPPWPEPGAAAVVRTAHESAVPTGGSGPAIVPEPEPVSELHRELTEIKGMLSRFSSGVQAGHPGVPARGTRVSGSGQRVGEDGEAFYGEWQRLLEEVEILPDLTTHLIAELRRQVDPLHIQRNDLARICLQNEIVRLVEPAYAQAAQKRIMAFVGPTGVGKTTTLAKMAAQYTLFHGKSCAIITIDTYRIGAVEQLNIYAEIMGVPLEIAMSPQDFAKAVQRHQNKEFIFVDTAGRPARNSEKVAELHSYFAVLDEPADVILVLSSNTKHRDLLRAVRHFGKVNYSKLIFTKVDETDTLGCILNMICHTGMPVIQITDGQNVPDDIQNMYPKKLAKLLTKGVEPDA